MAIQASFMLQAVRNRIRSDVLTRVSSNSSQAAAGCEMTDNGRPTVPYQGLIFYAIHYGDIINLAQREENFLLDEIYNFKVTVTLKTAHQPRYRFGDIAINDHATGLIYLVDLVKKSLNGYLSLTEEANTLVEAAYPDTVLQPFYTGQRPVFLSASDPVPRSSSWFGADPERDNGTPMGISQELRFQGLHLTRYIGQQ